MITYLKDKNLKEIVGGDRVREVCIFRGDLQKFFQSAYRLEAEGGRSIGLLGNFGLDLPPGYDSDLPIGRPL